MKKTLNKALSLVIVVIMLISTFPIYAFADDIDQEGATTYSVSFVVPGSSVEGATQQLAGNANLTAGPSLQEGYRWKHEETGNYYPASTDWTTVPVNNQNWTLVAELIPVDPPSDPPSNPPSSGNGETQNGEEGGMGIMSDTLDYPVKLIYKDAADGVVLGEIDYAENDFFVRSENEPAAPAAPEGKVFSHWYAMGDPEDTPYEFAIPEKAEPVATVTLLPYYTDLGSGDPPLGDPPAEPIFVNFYINYGENDSRGLFLYGTRSVSADGFMEGAPFTLLASYYPEGETRDLRFKYWGASLDATEPFDFTKKITGDVNVYAVFESTYLMTFLNGNGDVSHTDIYNPGQPVVNPGSDKAGAAPAGTHFRYWYVADSWDKAEGTKPEEFIFNVAYNKDITLAPYFSSEYFVIFVSAGTQVPYATVTAGGSVGQPGDPTRTGYEFNGWSTTENGSSGIFSFTTPINEDTFLYAQWRATPVEYKIVYWREKANQVGEIGNDPSLFEYYTSETKTAPAGTTLDFSNYPTGLGKTVAYSEYAFANSACTEVLGSGTTVVNVYFKRIIYTFEFDLGVYTDSLNSRRNFMAQMAFKDGSGVYQQGYNVTDSKYSFTAKFEQDIENLWPSSWNATFSQKGQLYNYGWYNKDYYFASWSSSGINNGYVSKRFTITDDMVPTDGVKRVFKADWASSIIQYKVEYWFDTLPHEAGQQFTLTRNAEDKADISPPIVDKFEKNAAFSQDIDLSGGLIAKDIEGVEAIALNHVWSGSNIETYRFFYRRNTYTLSFDTQGGGTIAPQTNIKYGTQLIDSFKPADPTKTVDGVSYKFLGWTLDAEGNTPFEFGTASTMPNQDLELFAQWESGALTIEFYDDFTGGNKIGEVGSDRNGKLDPARAATATGLNIGDQVPGKGEFEGWYVKMQVGFVSFSYDTPINDNLKLYASWKTTGFKVTYNLNGGTGEAPVENHPYYVNETHRVKDFSATPPSGKVFIGWKAEFQGTGSGTIYNPYDYYAVSGDVEFVAQYGNDSDYVAILYRSNYPDASADDERIQNVLKGSDNTLYGEVFTKTDYVLVGWAETDDATEAKYALGGTISIPLNATGNPYYTTLYGVWKQYVPTYSVTFTTDGNGKLKVGSGVPEDSVNVSDISVGTTWGAAVEEPTPVPNSGYYFVRWEPELPASNYTIKSNLSYKAIFAQQTAVTIVGNTGTRAYNGDEQKVTGATVSGLPDGYTLTYNGGDIANVTAKGTNASATAYQMNLNWNNVVIRDGAQNIVTQEFSPNITDGWIKIDPRPITIAISNEWAWETGDEVTKLLAVSDASTENDTGLVGNHKIAPASVTAKRTAVGTTTYGDSTADQQVVFTINSESNNVTSNYAITIQNGSLEIRELRDGMTGNLASKIGDDAVIYDGNNHSLNEATAIFNPEDNSAVPTFLYRQVADAAGTPIAGKDWGAMPSFKDVGTYYVQVKVSAVGYKESTAIGVLTINPFKITVEVGTGTKTYGDDDPTPLTAMTVTTKPVNGDAIDWTLPNGENGLDFLREEGEVAGTYNANIRANYSSINRGIIENQNPNYDFEYETGLFTIAKRAITLTAQPKTVKYPDAADLSFTITAGSVATRDQNGVDYMADLNALFSMTDDEWLTSAYDPTTYTGSPAAFDIDFTTKAHTNTTGHQNYDVTLVDSKVTANGGGLTVTDAYTVTYYNLLDGADVTNLPKPAVYNEKATVTVNTTADLLTHADYVFTGWRTTDGTVYVVGGTSTFAMPKSNVDLYAMWSFASDDFKLDASGFDKVYDGIEAKTALSGPLVNDDIVTYTLKDGTVHSYVVGTDTPYDFASTDVVDERITVTIERAGLEPFVIKNVAAQIRHREIAVGWTSDNATYNGDSQSAANVTGGVTTNSIAGTDNISYGTPAVDGRYADTYDMVFATGSVSSIDGASNEVHVKITRNGGDATHNYIITEDAGTFVIDPATITVTADDLDGTYNGDEQSKQTFVASYGTATPINGTAPETDISGLGFTGTHTLNVTMDQTITNVSESGKANTIVANSILDSFDEDVLENGSIVVDVVDGVLNLDKIKLTLTSKSETVVYDNSRHRLTGYDITEGVLAAEHELSGYEAQTSGTGLFDQAKYYNVGKYTNEFVKKGKVVDKANKNADVSANYEIELVEGELEITKRKAAVIAIPKIVTYNGTEQVVTTQYIGIPDVSTLRNLSELTELLELVGVDMPDISSEMLNSIADVMGWLGMEDTGFVNDLVTGTATASGKNVWAYKFNRDSLKVTNISAWPVSRWGADDMGNYEIFEIPSYLLIKPAKITVNTKSDSKVYDGTPLKRDAFTVTYNGNEIFDSEVAADARFSNAFANHTIDVRAINGSQTNVGSSNNKIQIPESLHTIIKDSDRTIPALAKLNFIVTYNYGTLEVTGAPLTVTVYGNTATYTGNPLTIKPDADGNLFSATGFLPGEEPTQASIDAVNAYLATLSLTDIGTAGQDEVRITTFDTNMLALKKGKIGNYKINLITGKLVLSPRHITYVSDAASKVYDGTPLTAPNVQVYDGNIISSDELAGATLIENNTDMVAHEYRKVINFTTSGQTNSGTSPNEFDLSALKITRSGGVNANNNFVIHKMERDLAVTKRPVTLTANSAGPFPADGNTYEASGFEAEQVAKNCPAGRGLLEGHILSGVFASVRASTEGTHYSYISGDPVVTTATDKSTNLAENYEFFGIRGQLVISPLTTNVIYYNYTINYYFDAIAGDPAASVTGQGEIGSTIPVTANLYLTEARIAAGYGDGLVYGSRVLTTDGQVINVLYSLTPGEEEPPEEEEIPEQDNPISQQPEEPIEDPDLPIAPPASWALLNLILAIVTVIVGIILLVGIFRKNKKDEDEKNADYAAEDEDEKRKSGIIWRIFGIVAAVLAPIVFFLTENMRNPMIFTDKWTLLMGLILLVQVVAVLLMRYVRNKEEDKDEERENV